MIRNSPFLRRIFSGLVGLASLLPVGCRCDYHGNCTKYSNYIENSPVAVVSEQALSAVNSNEAANLYKSFFPDNKPGFSYDIGKTKQTKTRLFFRAKGNFDHGFDYEAFAGIEARF